MHVLCTTQQTAGSSSWRSAGHAIRGAAARPLLGSSPSFSDVLPPLRNLEPALLARVSFYYTYNNPIELFSQDIERIARTRLQRRQGSSVSGIPRKSGSPAAIRTCLCHCYGSAASAASHLCNFHYLGFVQASVRLSLSTIGLGDVDLPHASSASHRCSGLNGDSEFESLVCAFVSAGNFGIQQSLQCFLV